MTDPEASGPIEEVAIIGMAGRFPGAKSIDAFWQNLREGVESITFFSDEELAAVGIDAATLRDPHYIKAKPMLEDVDLFDAAFFGYSPREAEILDPQQRLFLECAWEAMESAGYDPEATENRIGVYAGVGVNTYLLNNLYSNRGLNPAFNFQTLIGNDKDYLCTRVSYKLNLKGPSIDVQTACSTSLVAVCLACQSLLNHQCDMVLAGGVRISLPQKAGYCYQEGGIQSPDGHCRTFDDKARGTVTGDGVGIVVLKRLADALADRDCIHAVIRGTAVNNDGSSKIGYTAPSVNAQAEVIAEALAMAGIEPHMISYVEAHGTGTPLGDPIEISALTQVFRSSTQRTGFCPIGSVKTNIGHLDTAAGIAGLIKTVLALEHKMIPPSLNFERPNSGIDFAGGPFYVNTRLCEWKSESPVRYAGVSSFGIGGTNAHVVLSEAPPVESAEESGPWQLLVISAQSSSALDAATANLVEYWNRHPDLNIADVAHTLQVGRRAFRHRRVAVCRDRDEAVTALKTLDPAIVSTLVQEPKEHPVAFLFPGQGTQYVNMALELYQFVPAFREQVDYSAELLKPLIGLDLRDVLYPAQGRIDWATRELDQTWITQPALFVIEYTLAKLWMGLGISPHALVGHSIGEYVAACLAGVFSLKDALFLVATRGRMVQDAPAGAMLAVHLPERQVQSLLGRRLSLAAVNAPSQCVVSGPLDAIEEFEHGLVQHQQGYSRLRTSHAFHSEMMAPISEAFIAEVQKVDLKPPQIPYVSNVTGIWMTAADAMDPTYWARQLCQTVRFADGVRKLSEGPVRILLEVGPGQTLGTLAHQNLNRNSAPVVLASLGYRRDRYSDQQALLDTLGKLWGAGVRVTWPSFWSAEKRRRVPLPTYPFERQRYWLEPSAQVRGASQSRQDANGKQCAVSTTASSLPSPHLRPNLSIPYVPPSDEVEQWIAHVWEQVLRVEQVGRDDSFLALGGDSLMAIQVVAKLRETAQIEISLQSFLETPTVAALGELVKRLTSVGPLAEQTETGLSSPLVLVQSGSVTKRPLFLVHAAGGYPFYCRNLANYLGQDQPVYGFQAQGLDGKLEPITQIQVMASRYVKAMRMRQPMGPFLLGGWSMGGVVAFEMAQQLYALNQETALLALLDTPGPGQMPKRIEDEALILSSLCEDFVPIVSDLHLLGTDERLAFLLEQMRQSGFLAADIGLDEARNFLRVFKANVQAMFDYVPHVYPGRITFFRVWERREIDPPHPELPWIELATKGITIFSVPGHHQTIVHEPHVRTLAARLAECLAEAHLLEKG